MEALDEVLAELAAAREETGLATNTILDAAEQALGLVGQADADDHNRMTDLLSVILQACAFHDLTDQRMAKVEALLTGRTMDETDLLNGPQLGGKGLDQAAADALFADVSLNDGGDPA